MAGDHRPLGGRQIAFDDMKVCPADAADLDPQPNLTGPRLRSGKLYPGQRLRLDVGRLSKKHGMHARSTADAGAGRSSSNRHLLKTKALFVLVLQPFEPALLGGILRSHFFPSRKRFGLAS